MQIKFFEEYSTESNTKENIKDSTKDFSGEDINQVKSPIVGTFYSSATEGGEPFVKVGDTVTKGQVIGIIEAMKIMNDIESPYDGVIASVVLRMDRLWNMDNYYMRLNKYNKK